MRNIVSIFLCVLFVSQSAAAQHVKMLEIPEDCGLIAADPVISQKSGEEGYMEAYIQGVLDTKFPENGVSVTVRNGDVMLRDLPSDPQEAKKIIESVQKITELSVVNCSENKSASEQKLPVEGIWLPQSTVLFPTEIANPRQPCFKLGGRVNDRFHGRYGAAFVIGAQFPMYRWMNVHKGTMQLEVEGAVFALFNLSRHDYPMINADYYVGVPLTYAKGPFAYRARIYHSSSHVGDEYLQQHRHFHRKNKSFEAVDFSVDYSLNKYFRIYGIGGYVPFSDSQMHLKPFYVQYGFEARGKRTDFTQLYGQPFLSVHMENWQDTDWKISTSYALGYEWGKMSGIGRKVRLFLEYYQGFSVEGQFSRHRTKYLALCVSYGF